VSGPCTDCGGPDYQTLVSRIAELEAELVLAMPVYSRRQLEKKLKQAEAERDDRDEATCLTSFRVDKYEVYDKDEADARIAELTAENTELRKQGEILSTSRRLEEEAREQAEAERQEQVERREEEKLRAVNAEAALDALRELMREARDDFHGKAILFSSRYLDAVRQSREGGGG